MIGYPQRVHSLFCRLSPKILRVVATRPHILTAFNHLSRIGGSVR